MVRAKIIGTGSYVPARRLTNADLEKQVETTDHWIVERTGIRERRIAASNEAASDLSVHAARAALHAAAVCPDEIDLIVLATTTPDMWFPSTACIVQERLKATSAAAFDLSAACSGFVYALSVGCQYIESGTYRKILVVGVDVMSRIINWKDRKTCILFGDGAGAVVLAPSTDAFGVLSTHLCADGSLWEFIHVPGGGSAMPPSEQMLSGALNTIHMKGSETFKVAVRNMEKIAREALEANGLSSTDIHWIVAHQANLKILRAVADRLQVPVEKMVVNLDRYGNTSAASVPLALDEAVRDGRIQRGHLVLLLAFGGGLTWAASAIRW